MAYAGYLEFKDVVKKNQGASAGPTAAVPSGDKFGDAAKRLLDASYPFLKEGPKQARPTLASWSIRMR